MRKYISILLLVTFTVSQYAKQVSYIECVLSNYFAAPADKCDCAKIISKNKEATDPSPVTVLHNHAHIDDSYYPSSLQSRNIYVADGAIRSFFTTDSSLHEGTDNKPDRPPQV